VEEVAEAVGVDPGVGEPLRPCPGQDVCEELVPCEPPPELAHVAVLEPVPSLHQPLGPLGGVRLPRLEDIRPLLVVRYEPQVLYPHVAADEVAGPDHVVPLLVNLRDLPTSDDGEEGVEGDLQPHVSASLPVVPDEVPARGDPRDDGLPAVALGDEGVGDVHHVLVQGYLLIRQRRQPSNGALLSRLQPLDVPGGQGLHQLRVKVVGEPAGGPLHRAGVDPYPPGVPLLHDLPEQLPLLPVVPPPGPGCWRGAGPL